MKILDYDSARFENYIEVAEYFNISEKFEEYYKCKIAEYTIFLDDFYAENKVINEMLSWIECSPGIIYVSAYIEKERNFEISKISFEPLNKEEAEKIIGWLKKFF